MSKERAIPCDPEDMNEQRAEWAGLAIKAFRNEVYSLTDDDRYDDEAVLSDLLCDLRHWADRKKIDFDNRMLVAQGHYDDEIYCDEDVEWATDEEGNR